MSERIERLQQLYDEAGRPGARIFRNFARRKGESLTQQEAQEFVGRQSERQVLQARLPSDGKIASTREDTRWMADLIDFSQRREQKSGAKYVLVVIDVFTRELFTRPLKTKEAAPTLDAYRSIVAENGNKHVAELSSDMGREFTGTFAEYLKDHGTQHRVKDPQQLNSIATVDRGIQSLKQILANLKGAGDNQWSQLLKKATDIYNDREHSGLLGEAPDSVGKNEVVQYLLTAEAGQKIKHNNERWRDKTAKLREKGGFRTALPRDTWERIDQPKFDGKVREARDFVGANVKDEQGGSFPVKTVLPVQSGSADVQGDGEMLPGSRRTDEQRQALRQYSDALKGRLGAEGQMTLASVSRFLQSQEGFADTADVYRLPKQGRVVKFLRLFGYELTGTGPGIIVKRPQGAPSRATGAARGRPEGAVDLTPRVPRRGLPATQSIAFQPDNPFRAGSARHNRFEAFKGAGTVGEARRLGATPEDLHAALREGYAALQ